MLREDNSLRFWDQTDVYVQLSTECKLQNSFDPASDTLHSYT